MGAKITTADLFIKNLFRKSMRYAPDVIDALEMLWDTIPETLPTKWGFIKADLPFNRNEIDRMVPIPTSGGATNVEWEGRKYIPSTGSLRTRWIAAAGNHGHASITANTTSSEIPQQHILTYLARSAVVSDCEFGYADFLTTTYRPFAIASQSAESGQRLFVTTHVLRHWLPDMFWATVFGPAYVTLFGMERLLSTPAFKVERLDVSHVLIQLTPDLYETVQKPDVIYKARATAKAHLGSSAFFQAELAYDWHAAGNYGRVFTVPHFSFDEE